MNSFFSLDVKTRNGYWLGILALLASFLILGIIYKGNVQKGGYRSNDIFYIWSDGYEIAHGQNPYSKIHGSDMLKNQKYSTYLPGFFLIVSAYVSFGYDTFEEWLEFWKPAGFFIHCLLGTLLFFVLMPKGGFWLALFGSQFWLISRWPVSVMNSGQIDGLALLTLLVSLLLLDKYRKLALLLFGASLSVKQIGIFMLPVYLMLSADKGRSLLWNLRVVSRDLAMIASVPFILCLPFLIWDAKGLILSCLFSATRSPGGHLKVPSIDEILGYVGIIAKIPMLIMMLAVYFLVLEKKIGAFAAGLAIYLSFVSFNSVLFKQYMPWFCGFLGLALSEYIVAGYKRNGGRSDEVRSE